MSRTSSTAAGTAETVKDIVADLRKEYGRLRDDLGKAKKSKAPNESDRNKLIELKKVLYDADDLIDDLGDLPHDSPPPPDLLQRYTDISSRFNESGSQNTRLDIRINNASKKRLVTGSFPKERNLVGVHHWMELVIKILTDSELRKSYLDSEGNTKFTVLPIVGVGGIGKTGLIQHVYHDRRVKGHFPVYGWIWMHENEDAFLMRSIVEFLTRSPCPRIAFDQLKRQAIDRIRGSRKLLLVLDDVGKSNQGFLKHLWDVLRDAKEGSMVVITTRDYTAIEKACKGLRSILPLPMRPLGDDDSSALFEWQAFPRGDQEMHPDLLKKGKDLIHISEGLPLLVKNIARKLKSENDVKKLEEGLNVDKKEISDSLESSYRDLSPELKSCLEYCSLFPKGHAYVKKQIARLWMAENLLDPTIEREGGNSKEGKELEDIGIDYFMDLLYSSFFWYLPQDREGIDIGMPNFVDDFVQSVVGEGKEYVRVLNRVDWNLIPDVRILSYVVDNPRLVNKPTEPIKFEPRTPDILRALLFINLTKRVAHVKLTDDLLQKLTHLRALDLSDTNLEKLPDSISCLQHLRYLDLRGTKISDLPQSICELRKLQTLGLRWCTNLRYLPNDMWNLTGLRHLELIHYHSSFCMPKGIGKLTNLQTLLTFKVGKKDGEYIGIKELEGLNKLKGELCISGLCNVNPQDAKLAKLGEKKYLEKLTLSWDFVSSDGNGAPLQTSEKDINVADDKEVLNNLKPHTKLTHLTIKLYRSFDFPGWVGEKSFTRMTFLKLEDCMHSTSLPDLRDLRNLKFVSVIRMRSLFQISRCPFPSLKHLCFTGMQGWVEWSGAVEALDALEIVKCPKLERLPPISSLTELKLNDCDSLASLPMFNQLEKLVLKNCLRLAGLPKFELIETMEIENCEELTMLPGLPKLETLSLYGCHKLASLTPLSSLKTLTLTFCKGLSSLPCELPWLTELTLRNIPNLNEVPQITSLKKLNVENCEKVSKVPHLDHLVNLQLCACDKLSKLEGLPSLLNLTIMYCNELASLPDLPKLISLWIDDCKKIKCDNLGDKLMEKTVSFVITNSNLGGFSENWIEQLKSSSDSFIDQYTLAKQRPATEEVTGNNGPQTGPATQPESST